MTKTTRNRTDCKLKEGQLKKNRVVGFLVCGCRVFFVALGWRGYCGIYASRSFTCKCGYYLSCAFWYFSGKLRGKFDCEERLD
jgi:hypothetical protein